VKNLGSAKIQWTFSGSKISCEFAYSVKQQITLDKFRYAKGDVTTASLRLEMQRAMQNDCAVFRTGETLARQQTQASRKEDVLNALHKAASDLRGQLGHPARRAGGRRLRRFLS